jgi:hypothetical protein
VPEGKSWRLRRRPTSRLTGNGLLEIGTYLLAMAALH